MRIERKSPSDISKTQGKAQEQAEETREQRREPNKTVIVRWYDHGLSLVA